MTLLPFWNGVKMTREYNEPILGHIEMLGAVYLNRPPRKLFRKELKPAFSEGIVSEAFRNLIGRLGEYNITIFDKHYHYFKSGDSTINGKFSVYTSGWDCGAYERASVSATLKINEDDKRKEKLVKILSDWEDFVASRVDEKQKKLVSIITNKGEKSAF